MPKFFIGSTGHSGTRYTWKVLHRLGVDAGHEDFYSLPRRESRELLIECSWLSYFHLHEIKGLMIHQVRHPLKVLTSFIYDKSFNQEAFDLRMSIIDRTGDSMTDYCQMIYIMNEAFEKKSDFTYQVESIDINRILEWADVVKTQSEINRVMVLRKTVNSHTNHECLTWDQIPDSKWKEKIFDQSQRYYPS